MARNYEWTRDISTALLARVADDDDENDDNGNESNDTIQLGLLLQHLALEGLGIGLEQISSISESLRLVDNNVELLTSLKNLIDVIDHDALDGVELLLDSGGDIGVGIVPFVHDLVEGGGEVRHGVGLAGLDAIAIGADEILHNFVEEAEGDSERKVSVAQSDVGNAVVIQDMEIKLVIIVESVLASRGELGKKAHGDLSKVTSGLVVHGSGGFLT